MIKDTVIKSKINTTAEECCLNDDIWKHVEADYKIKRVIGHGSYGNVVKAKCKQTGHYYAIKHVTDIFESPETARSIVRELQLLQKLS